VIFLNHKIKKGIESFFHYQRVREIFFVMETALSASKRDDTTFDKIFGGLVEEL